MTDERRSTGVSHLCRNSDVYNPFTEFKKGIFTMIENGLHTNRSGAQTGTFAVKAGLAQMLKGGVIMDVVTPDQARIAEEAGACAVMALERVPADIRKDGGVARMSDPSMIKEIIASVTI